MGQALVLLSGGLDSSTVAAMAVKEFGPENVIALTLYYGQKHQIEIQAAKAVANYLRIKEHLIRPLPKDIFQGFGSALVDQSIKVPRATYQELIPGSGPLVTYVPFRNGIFLSIATAIALTKSCKYVYYGAHAEDAQDFAYPDCTSEFNGAMANAIYIGTYCTVRLVVPLQWVMKVDIVRLAIKLKVPIHLTYSCYSGTQPSCGRCPTCLSRRSAFGEAGVYDLIPYADD